MSHGQAASCRLTRLEMNPRGGCQCKLPGLELRGLLEASLQSVFAPSVMVSAAGRLEDCAVVDINGASLLLNTELNPIVGIDLRAAGRIAALHAMSDLYACGAVPCWALVNLVVNPEQPPAYAEHVLAGIQEACSAEGAVVVGGHTLVGNEALAGVTVIGRPRTGTILRKHGAKPGDLLLLSKPLGVGLVLRGYKLGVLDDEALESAVSLMTTSNASASSAALAAGVSAATDVTGFGLLGHLAEMLAPTLGARLHLSKIPMMTHVTDLPSQVWNTIWIDNNLEYVNSLMRMSGVVERDRLAGLLDPQTNGGLLVSANDREADRLLRDQFVVVGSVTTSPGLEILET
jgi:selenide,water dikinase